MSLPDMSDVLGEWAEEHTVSAVTTITTDFVPTETKVDRTVSAVVQPADKTRLNTEQIDWSLAYIQIHTADTVATGERISYMGADYKIIEVGPYNAYGYTEALGEQIK